nr:PREDICTED: secretory carrier-associated membrane protein 1 isoform X2 [Bemisia tabaci]
MSMFDENPFGEPTVDNPFADPSVQQVTQQSSNVQKGIDSYNPFAPDESSQGRPTVVRGAANPPLQTSGLKSPGPAIMVATQDTSRPPPAYSASGQQTQINLTTEELRRRQEELDRKAAELERREEELRNAPYNVRRNNWPPFPDNFCFQPCFYQDFSIDIPFEFQRIVRLLYYLWMYHASLMCLNVIGGLLIIFHKHQFTVFTVGIVYLVVFTPFSYLCWFRPAYKAFRNDSSVNFMVFFFMFFFQFLITLSHSIGTSGSGTCGIFTAISVYDSTPGGIITGLFVFLIALGFCSAAAMDLILLSKIHRIYRSSGASFAKATQEFTTEFLSNEHVRGMATTAATTAVRSQFQQQGQPGQQPQQPDRRY